MKKHSAWARPDLWAISSITTMLIIGMFFLATPDTITVGQAYAPPSCQATPGSLIVAKEIVCGNHPYSTITLEFTEYYRNTATQHAVDVPVRDDGSWEYLLADLPPTKGTYVLTGVKGYANGWHVIQ